MNGNKIVNYNWTSKIACVDNCLRSLSLKGAKEWDNVSRGTGCQRFLKDG